MLHTKDINCMSLFENEKKNAYNDEEETLCTFPYVRIVEQWESGIHKMHEPKRVNDISDASWRLCYAVFDIFVCPCSLWPGTAKMKIMSNSSHSPITRAFGARANNTPQNNKNQCESMNVTEHCPEIVHSFEI